MKIGIRTRDAFIVSFMVLGLVAVGCYIVFGDEPLSTPFTGSETTEHLYDPVSLWLFVTIIAGVPAAVASGVLYWIVHYLRYK